MEVPLSAGTGGQGSTSVKANEHKIAQNPMSSSSNKSRNSWAGGFLTLHRSQ